MCNLYRLRKTAAEVARLFDVALVPGGNAGDHVYPGQPGWVAWQNQMKTMHWGFPLVLKGKAGEALRPRPVNNARSDKLASPFWRASFAQRRCLIPMTAFAEAQGAQGAKTRTWLSLPDRAVFACAGLWRGSAEWGPVYALIVTEPSEQVRPVHDRMPVILRPDQQDAWLSAGPEAALDLCRPYDGALAIERTDEPWTAR